MSVSKGAKEIAQEAIKANDLRSAIAALEDGSYLSEAGYTDADQEDIECAHAYLKEMDALMLADDQEHDERKAQGYQE